VKVGSPSFRAAAAVTTAVLFIVLVFLYSKSQQFDQADYLQDVGTLRHLKQVDAQWERDVLKSRIGANRHYDALADASAEMERLLQKLDADLAGIYHGEAATLEQERQLLVEAVHRKVVLVEQFKTKNSVLRNSMSFLPTAAAGVLDVLEKPRGSQAGAEHATAAAVNSLLLSSVLYSQEASGQRAAEIEAGLRGLTALEGQLTAGAREQLDLFRSHVQIILREQKTVNELVSEIAAAPTGAGIDAMYQTLADEQQRSAAQSRNYRAYLMMFTGALVALLLYAATRLLRQAETDRANRELQSVNEQLEHRVQERTLELQNTQGELVATARRAGRAEIATNVLHNVGNILNSVNVSAGMIADTLRRSRAHGLSRAVQMMDEHKGDLARFLTADEKGRLLPGYLSGAAATVAQEQQDMLKELDHLTKSIDHIKDVVSTQQSYAGGSSVVEPARIDELAEDALRMNAGPLAQQQVKVVREFMDLPLVRVDRARVLQILVNLISNANNAMEDSGAASRRIVLRICAEEARLRISVKDDGVGITPENLTRIFSHGFTTRASGHGFGLHSCALAARQMGGTLGVHSDGPGCGAIFTLELPLDAVPVPA
jgi:two-component system, NtrC family, sensor kinase